MQSGRVQELADEVWPMFTDSAGKAHGAVVATSTAASSIDLTTLPPPDKGNGASGTGQVIMGHYVTITAEGTDAYVSFGPTSASVTAGNAPSPTATGTGTAGLCEYLPVGYRFQVYIPEGPGEGTATRGQSSIGRFMGYVTKTGTGFLRISQSSR